jgi:hypothetical protein
LPLHSSQNQILLNGLAVSAALIAAPFSARNAVSIGEYGTMCDTLKCNTMHTELLPESITEVQERARRWIEALPKAIAEPAE